jgi:choline dehydrogenase
MVVTPSYDYIVIGSGSAGAIVAARLSEDKSVSVLLIEAGGSDKNIFIKMPTALGIPMNTRKFNWGFKSEPERFLNDRIINCPRGRVLGGSSSINGMVYVRGNPFDFDEWEMLGANGWSFKNCLPYFKRVENHKIKNSMYTGNEGAVSISGGNNMKNPLYNAFIDSAIEAGYKKTEDYNGYQQEGFGQKFMNVDSGVRASTSYAYLDPIKQRKNLTILSKSLVTKIIFNNKKACGVELIKNNKNYSIYSHKEIILSAGSIGSPHILQVSGVGCRKKLNNAGIQVIHDLPGVGENLQDHLEFNFQYRCKQPITLNGQISLLKKLKIGIEWIITKKGLGASNHFEACGFIRSKAGVKWPDIQYHFLPGAITYDGTVAFFGHGFQVHVGHNKPTSRGSVTVTSSDIKVHPKIHFNYLSTESDRAGFRASVRLTREIMQQQSMQPFLGQVIQPSENIQTNDEIDEFIRNSVDSAYHPCGTCRMGKGANAVVDEHLSVFGIDGLRVIDSSVFPSIPNGNLNAPTMMLAERASDIIKNKVMKPEAKPKVYLNKKWQTSQR